MPWNKQKYQIKPNQKKKSSQKLKEVAHYKYYV